MRFGYNEYMVHHYAYITNVVEVREPESYAELAKDANGGRDARIGGERDLGPG